MVLGFLFRREESSVQAVYEKIVAQARQPVFYRDYGIPDSVEGRFEMVVLHVFCLFYRLRDGGERQRTFTQKVFDRFFEDMDQSMREMGIGDEGVRRRIRKMSESFFGRSSAYAEALENNSDEALGIALNRNILSEKGERLAVERLVAYMHCALDHLSAQEADEIMRGSLTWVLPENVTAEETARDGL